MGQNDSLTYQNERFTTFKVSDYYKTQIKRYSYQIDDEGFIIYYRGKVLLTGTAQITKNEIESMIDGFIYNPREQGYRITETTERIDTSFDNLKLCDKISIN